VNWQPPGCLFAAERVGGRVVLTATREKPRELVRIDFERVEAALAMDLDDSVSLEVTGTEDDLQAFLARTPQVIEPGFRFWSRERASGRGPMDLYGEDAQGRRVVVECKRRAAGVAEADQLRRYVERERAARGADAPGRGGKKVRGILVAPAVSEKARKYLDESGLEYREVDWEKLMRPAKELLKGGQRTLGSF
jgi:RecB family endonuclease NucS